MIRTSKMILLSAVVLGKYSELITKQLLKLGQLDFISVKEMSPEISDSIKSINTEYSPSKLSDMRREVEGFILSAGLKLPEHVEIEKYNFDIEKIKNIETVIEEIEVSLENIRLKQKNNQRDILRLKEIQKQLEGSKENVSFLQIRSGFLEGTYEEILEQLRVYQCVALKTVDANQYIIINLKRDSEKIDEVLSNFNWSKVSQTNNDNITSINVKIDKHIDVLKINQTELVETLKNKIKSYESQLDEMWKTLNLSEKFFSMQGFFNKTDKTYIFSGWIPLRSKKIICDTILKTCNNDCYIEWTTADQATKAGIIPPVELETPKLLKPFEKVIVNYQTPEYGTLNPTYITAITFLIMFGMMFGDVGHGAVIAITGLIGLIVTKGKNSLMSLLIYCGISAMFFGVLFGSYFGWSWFPAVWFNYHGAVAGGHTSGPITSIMQILALTVWLGVGTICLGMIFYWYNCIVKKRWFNLITDKNGLAGATMYIAGVYCAYIYMTTNSFSNINWNIIAPFFAVPGVVFFVKLIIEAMHNNADGKFHFGEIPLIIMEWFIELLEVFSGFLANTLSFLRVAGLGIAHVSLMTAFFYMADMFGTSTVLNTIGYSAMIIIGNILVIGLEGLSAGIQTLRLHYYEFFGKFLIGGGTIYNPIKIK